MYETIIVPLAGPAFASVSVNPVVVTADTYAPAVTAPALEGLMTTTGAAAYAAENVTVQSVCPAVGVATVLRVKTPFVSVAVAPIPAREAAAPALVVGTGPVEAR